MPKDIKSVIPRFYSVIEAASYLGISVPLVRRLTQNEGFPARRISGRNLIDRAGLDLWIESQPLVSEGPRTWLG